DHLPVHLEVTTSDHVYFWSRNPENKGSEPHGLHNGHFKAAAQSPVIAYCDALFRNVIEAGNTVHHSGEAICASVQEAATLWAGGIRATGGAINPEKSFWWLIDFEWDSRTGKWKFRGKKAVALDFELQIQGLSGSTESLRRLEPDDLERTLGVMLSPLENLEAHKAQMVAKAKDWAEQL
ncbi:unnamed protein product, partial [Cylindrotheca closterium]